jgi:hypothetical protein
MHFAINGAAGDRVEIYVTMCSIDKKDRCAGHLDPKIARGRPFLPKCCQTDCKALVGND